MKIDMEFELNIDESYKDGDCFDEWGAAIIWATPNGKERIGAEYNYCIDSGENCSAIYKMTETEFAITTDSSDFVHYEINWNDKDWRNKLAEAMAKAVIKFIEEDK